MSLSLLISATRFVVLMWTALALPSVAVAAELVLERTAIDKLLVQTLFKEDGRKYLVRTACETYLETPTSAVKGGRVMIRFHITSKVGVPAGKVCVGPTFATWSSMSGRPVATGAVIRLEDIRIEEVEDAKVRFLLKTGLAPAVPQAVELDVQKSVVSMLKVSSPQMESVAEFIQISDVQAENDRLTVKFDFKLLAR